MNNHWDEMLERLDKAELSYGVYINADGERSVAVPDSRMVTNLIHEFRHVIRYARDAEQGNQILRDQMSANPDISAVPHDVRKSGQEEN